MPSTFTESLLQRYASEFEKATNHPFLDQAGQGTLSHGTLQAWLRQDYLYAFIGYPKYASLLLSRLPISPSLPTDKTSRALADALPLLSFSLANIARETEFFKQTADAYRLDLHTGPTDALLGRYEPLTKSYVDFLIATAAGGSLEEGLVVLWAMEKCYLTAWQSALKLMQSSSWATMPNDDMSATQKALKVFIDNWTCPEFVGFVDDCTAVVDSLGLEDGGHVAQRCEEAFKYCLYLEQRFWPSV